MLADILFDCSFFIIQTNSIYSGKAGRSKTFAHQEEVIMEKKRQRLSKIVDILRSQDTMTVRELSERLEVSLMTVRRDLDELQAEGIVERSYGKAVLCRNAPHSLYENIENIYSLTWASGSMDEQKSRIAQYAASLIEPGEVIILDNGSTTDRIADHIPYGIDLTVACYNLNILVKLANRDKMNIIFAGGYFHPSDQMFESAENINFLGTIRAHKLFLSASGVHTALGMTCAHDFEVAVKQTVLKSALKKILVADSSKFGTVKTVYFEKMDVLDMIITDTGLSREWAEIIRGKGIELVMV